MGSYPLAWGMSLSATYLNTPGVQVTSTYSLPNSAVVSTLGRNLAACGAAAVCTAAKTISLIEPFSMFEERLTKFDIRLSKNVQAGRLRVQPRLDVYNVFNANTITSINTTFGPAFRRPLTILDGRFAKLGVQVDFQAASR